MLYAIPAEGVVVVVVGVIQRERLDDNLSCCRIVIIVNVVISHNWLDDSLLPV